MIFCISATAISVLVYTFGLQYARHYIKNKDENVTLKTPVQLAVLIAFAAYICFMTYSMCVMCYMPIIIVKHLSAMCGLAVAAVTDIKVKLIPNAVCLTLIILWALETLVDVTFFEADLLFELEASLIGAAFGAGLFLIGRLISKNGMGMGDIKLMFSTGLLLRFEDIFGLMLWGLIFSLIFSLVLIIMRKAKGSTLICMAPFFLAGEIISQLFAFLSYLSYDQ